MHVAASAAFGASGRSLQARLAVTGQTLELWVDAGEEAVLVDPVCYVAQTMPRRAPTTPRRCSATARSSSPAASTALCQNGICGGAAVVCPVADQCHTQVTCNPATGTFPGQPGEARQHGLHRQLGLHQPRCLPLRREPEQGRRYGMQRR